MLIIKRLIKKEKFSCRGFTYNLAVLNVVPRLISEYREYVLQCYMMFLVLQQHRLHLK